METPFDPIEEYLKQKDKLLKTLSALSEAGMLEKEKARKDKLRISLPPRTPSTPKPPMSVEAVPKGTPKKGIFGEMMQKGMTEVKEAPKATVDAEGRLKLPPRVPSTPKPPMSVEAVPVKPNRAQMEKMFEEIMAREPRVTKSIKNPIPYAGPVMAAGEVLAGENDLGKMAAGVIGSELLATLGAAVPGNPIVKGVATGTGAVAGYPIGQKVYEKAVPESVQEKLRLTPEERMKIKDMLSKIKKKVF